MLLIFFIFFYNIKITQEKNEVIMVNKKENFKRISESRVSKIIILLNQLTNLTNASFYEYSEKDILNIFNEIEQEMNKSKNTLVRSADKKNKKFEL